MTTKMEDEPAPSAEALQIFGQLKNAATPAKLLRLRDEIDAHLLQLQKLARGNEMMPIDLAEAIASGLHALLGNLSGYTEEQQSDIIGAALYFVSTDDEIADTASILGLDDDAAIFNDVVTKIGRGDLAVDL